MAKSRTFSGEVREILSAGAKEMGIAVDSIRNEVIDKAWFDRKTLDPATERKWLREDYEPQGIEGPQDYSQTKEATRDDVYGRDVGDDRADWNNVRDVDQDRHRDSLGEARWESHKDKAEQLYGRDHEREQEIER